MKRGTQTHPKTLDLLEQLAVEPWGAVGILESLWLFAAQHAKRGDIGRHTDTAIARAIGWKGDPTALVSTLVSCRWLDACPCHRLRVHDWPDHADQGVKRSDEVIKHGFAECYAASDAPRLEASSEKLETTIKDATLAQARLASQARPTTATSTADAPATSPAPVVEGGLGGGVRRRVVAELVAAADVAAPGVDAVISTTASGLPLRAVAANPLVDRDALIREGHGLITELTKALDLDPTEVLSKASEWNGRGHVRFDAMTDDRLAHTLQALRTEARRIRGEPEPQVASQRGRASPKAVQRDAVLVAGIKGGLRGK